MFSSFNFFSRRKYQFELFLNILKISKSTKFKIPKIRNQSKITKIYQAKPQGESPIKPQGNIWIKHPRGISIENF